MASKFENGFMVRKCDRCKETIFIDKNNTNETIFYGVKAYHNNCITEECKAKMNSKRSAIDWKGVQDSIPELLKETNKKIKEAFAMNDLNLYLINKYDIISLSTRFWQFVHDLKSGIFKGKQCHPVSVGTLYSAWVYCQNKLDDIDRYNREHNKGPVDGQARINYDFSIVVSRIPEYVKIRAKEEAKAVAAKQEIEAQTNKIVYDNIKSQLLYKQDVNDISSLVDNIF